MKVPIRKTIAGTEYWDTEKKQSLFVPKGSEPDFEVTENPKSMITPEGDKVVIAYDESDGKEKAVVTEMVKQDDGTIEVKDIKVTENIGEDEEPSELDSMNTKELRAYAKKNGITIPAAIRSKGDILRTIEEAEK